MNSPSRHQSRKSDPNFIVNTFKIYHKKYFVSRKKESQKVLPERQVFISEKKSPSVNSCKSSLLQDRTLDGLKLRERRRCLMIDESILNQYLIRKSQNSSLFQSRIEKLEKLLELEKEHVSLVMKENSREQASMEKYCNRLFIESKRTPNLKPLRRKNRKWGNLEVK